MKRRSALTLLAGAAAAASAAGGAALPARAGRERVLVLLELRGGNDGLNTVAPLADPLYRRIRQDLALKAGLPLGRGLVLHPSLAALRPAWEARRLAFALGVGWPIPNRSHFKASDQWASASPQGEGPGWLAAAMDRLGSTGPLVALAPSGGPALEGCRVTALQMAPALLRGRGPLALDPSRAGDNAVLRRMLELELAGSLELQRLRSRIEPLPASLAVPRSPLGLQVTLALQLIASGVCPPVLQMAHVGFDTHAAQASRHALALRVLGEALAAFEAGLAALPHRPRVTLLGVSEFGRRLRPNASGGTDHGSASVAFLLGDDVPHPFLGTYPRLDALDDRGDLIPSLAPPVLYEEVLRQLG